MVLTILADVFVLVAFLFAGEAFLQAATHGRPFLLRRQQFVTDSADQFVASRTGGAYESHSIDDFLLQLVVDPTSGVPRLASITNQPPGNVVIIGSGNPGQNVALAATNVTNT